MKKARYLAAGAASLAKPFFLGSLAVGIGLADSGGVALFYLRYLIFPQLIPAVCLFFLYFDEERYKTYKPLVAIFSLGSVIFLAAMLLPATGNLQKLILASKNAQGFSRNVIAFAAAFLIDLFCGLILIPGSRARDDRDSATAEKSGATIPSKEQ